MDPVDPLFISAFNRCDRIAQRGNIETTQNLGVFINYEANQILKTVSVKQLKATVGAHLEGRSPGQAMGLGDTPRFAAICAIHWLIAAGSITAVQ